MTLRQHPGLWLHPHAELGSVKQGEPRSVGGPSLTHISLIWLGEMARRERAAVLIGRVLLSDRRLNTVQVLQIGLSSIVGLPQGCRTIDMRPGRLRSLLRSLLSRQTFIVGDPAPP